MNKEQLLRKRNEIAQLVRFSNRSGSHRNYIKISTANTYEHELAKFRICWRLAKENKEFLTEAIFSKNNKRADILVLDDSKVIEILKSEKLKDAKKKVKSYPKELEIEFIELK